jgi:hypothetical protein
LIPMWVSLTRRLSACSTTRDGVAYPNG